MSALAQLAPDHLVNRARRRWYRRGLPHAAYLASGAALQPVRDGYRYVTLASGIDGIDAYRRNAERVLGHLNRIGADHVVLRAHFGERAALAVRRSDLSALLSALQTDALAEPLYLSITDRAGTRRDRLVARESGIRAEGIARMTVYAHLRDVASLRRYGEDYGVEVEVWPDRAFLRDTTEDCEVDVYGIPSRTRPPFDVPGPERVRFPVDVVYLWVDGSDPAWLRRRAARLAALGGGSDEATVVARYQQFDELRYSLRSVARFAPWVRQIFVVTDQQRPEWLREDHRLRVVDHREILPDDALPTFNSHAIAAAVHRIPGLADRFLIMNDDIALGRPVPPERFFSGNGMTLFFLSPTRLGPDPSVAHEAARLRTADLIEQATGTRPTHVFRHTPVALNREWMAELEARFDKEWQATLRSPLRAADDIVPEWLHHWIGYHERHCLPGTLAYGYLGFGDDTTDEQLRDFGAGAAPDAFCLNDVSTGSDPGRAARIAAFFERQFPHPSPWEAAGPPASTGPARERGQEPDAPGVVHGGEHQG